MARKLFEIAAPFLSFCLVGIAGAFIPRLHVVLFQLPFWLTSALVTASFDYRRAFHPDRLPATLAANSPTLLKLKRIKRGLAWGTGAAFFLCVAILMISTLDSNTHPLLTAFALSPFYVAFVAWIGLRQYIRERTKVRTPVVINGWPGRRLSPSEFSPFHSDHWGEGSKS